MSVPHFDSLKEAAGRVVREHHNLSVHEFGSKFAEMFGIELDPRNYGCHEMKDLVIKMSIEFQIFDLQVTDNRLIVNIAQVRRTGHIIRLKPFIFPVHSLLSSHPNRNLVAPSWTSSMRHQKTGSLMNQSHGRS